MATSSLVAAFFCWYHRGGRTCGTRRSGTPNKVLIFRLASSITSAEEDFSALCVIIGSCWVETAIGGQDTNPISIPQFSRVCKLDSGRADFILWWQSLNTLISWFVTFWSRSKYARIRRRSTLHRQNNFDLEKFIWIGYVQANRKQNEQQHHTCNTKKAIQIQIQIQIVKWS